MEKKFLTANTIWADLVSKLVEKESRVINITSLNKVSKPKLAKETHEKGYKIPEADETGNIVRKSN